MNREELLRRLESVQPGVSPKEILEQSDCIVFQNGEAFTFNDEVACRVTTGLSNKIEGAVKSKPLMELLRKLNDDEIEVDQDEEGKIHFSGKGRRASFHVEKDVCLPIDVVEKPSSWKKLPGDFCEAAMVISRCTGNDTARIILSYVHVHSEYMEACQASSIFARWNLKTPVDKPLLIKGESLRHVASLGVTQFSETSQWMHFKTSSGLVLSCRLYLEEYPDLSHYLELKGKSVSLPSSLVDEADRASVFSNETPDENRVLVKLTNGKVSLESVGINGSYFSRKKVEWEGDDVSFLVSPTVLTDVLRRQRKVVISDDKMIVDSGSYRLVACLLKKSKTSTEPKTEKKPKEKTKEKGKGRNRDDEIPF